MESVVAIQSVKGQVSTPGAQPKDEQINNQTEPQGRAYVQDFLGGAVEQILKKWFSALGPDTKLAVSLVRILELGDSNEEDFIGHICNQYEQDSIQTASNLPSDISAVESLIYGMFLQWLNWRKNLYAGIESNPAKKAAELISAVDQIKDQAIKAKQPDSDEPSTGSEFLDNLINNSSCDTIAAMYAIATLLGNTDKLGNDVYGLIQDKVKQFRKGEFPHDADPECEILPATSWFTFADGVRVRSND